MCVLIYLYINTPTLRVHQSETSIFLPLLTSKKKVYTYKNVSTRVLSAHNSNRHVSEFDGTISLMDLLEKKNSRHRVLGDQAESSISYNNNNNMRARSINNDCYSVRLWLLSACTYIYLLTAVIFSHTRARDNYARTIGRFSTAKWTNIFPFRRTR